MPNYQLTTHRPNRLPSLGLSSSFNLGKADIYPSTSGKAPAVSRLMRRLHVEGRECVALFDDDNDLGMAALCASGRRIAVSVTHDSVRQVCGLVGVERESERSWADTHTYARSLFDFTHIHSSWRRTRPWRLAALDQASWRRRTL